MMTSVCINNPEEEIRFHVIVDDSVTEKQKRRMSFTISKFNNKEIVYYLIDKNCLSSYPSIGEYATHITNAAYYRLLLGEILPPSLKKVIYLDGDIIVVDKLKELWDVELTLPVACVPEMIGQAPWLDYPTSLGYFNSGVLLINLDYWRTHKSISVFMDFINHNAEMIKFHDQDVLNYVFCKTKMTLPLKFNVQNEFFFKEDVTLIDLKKYGAQFTEAINTPVIVHFTRSQKPWIIGCPHPYTKEFNKYRDMTPWRHRNIFDTLKYSGWHHTIGYYARKLGLIGPMDNPYITIGKPNCY